jgi:hypothetical protein
MISSFLLARRAVVTVVSSAQTRPHLSVALDRQNHIGANK